MKITNEWLAENRACKFGAEWFSNQTETDLVVVLRKLIVENHFSWANWLIVRNMGLKQKRQYAVFAAEQVLPIYEKKYPDDKRPRNAIDAAKKVIEDDTEENRNAAYTAYANAAAYAACDADASLKNTIIEYGILLLGEK